MITLLKDSVGRIHEVWPGSLCPASAEPSEPHSLQVKAPDWESDSRAYRCLTCGAEYSLEGTVTDEAAVIDVLREIVDKFPGVLASNLILACHREFDTTEKYKHLRGKGHLIEKCLHSLIAKKDLVGIAFISRTLHEKSTGTCVFNRRTAFQFNGVWITEDMPL